MQKLAHVLEPSRQTVINSYRDRPVTGGDATQAVAKLAGAQLGCNAGAFPSLERSVSGSRASAEPPEGSGSLSAEEGGDHAARTGADGAGGLEGLAEAAEQGM